MKTTLTITAGIFSLISLLFFKIEHSQLGFIFLGIAVFLSVCALIVHLKKPKTQREPSSLGPLKLKSYSADENARLVIKSIGTAENGFINFNEIVNDTNLPLKIINKALEWLVVNKFATSKKGRKDNVYELTPKGRDSFGHIINPNNNT